nr:unnamed protein product [Callosobruchus chinensis]
MQTWSNLPWLAVSG